MKELLFLLFLAAPFCSRGQKKIFVNEYLNIGVGARGLAMGGSQVAVANDVTAAYWNVAGLAQLDSGWQVGLMHAEYFSGNAKYDYAALALPLKDKKRTLGISFMRFATDDIPYTIDFVEPDGSFNYNNLKSISAGDYSFLISYAQDAKIFKNPAVRTSIGANAKIIYRHIGKMGNAWGIGVDVGFQGAYKRWLLGIMAKDITTTYTAWSYNLTAKEKAIFAQTGNEIITKSYEIMLPRFNLGVARGLTKPGKKVSILASLDFDFTTDGNRGTLLSSKTFSIDPHMGLEAAYKQTIFLRAGVGNFQQVLDDTDTSNQKNYTIFQPAMGVGLKLGVLNLDYAYTRLQTQSSPLYTHVVSLRLDMQSSKKRKAAQLNNGNENQI